MAKWIELLSEEGSEKKCSKHKGRLAVAVQMREGKGDKPPVPTRYYCQECLSKEEPGIADHGPD